MIGQVDPWLNYQDPVAGESTNHPNHVITSEDVINLAHARPNYSRFWLSDGYRTQIEEAHSIYSLELAKLLPQGHPFRRFHGIMDPEPQVIRWILADPDLGRDDRQLIEETLLEEDAKRRSQHWPRLVETVRNESWAWHEIRSQLLFSLRRTGDDFLDELHPREAGVLRSVASGMTVAQIAERFGVTTNRIVQVHAEASEKVRQEFAESVNLLQDHIESMGIVELSRLAGLVRDLPLDRRTEFAFTRILLQFCSARIYESPNNAVYVLSNSAHSAAKPL